MAALTVAAGQEDRCDMLLVVRHADAGDKGSWDGPDVGRPLSPEGRRQADGLVVRLEDYPVDRILCSPTVRCRQTVQPMASDRLLGIEAVAALGVDAGPAEVLALFWDRRLRNAVLCTHGETIGRLLSQLAADGLVTAAPLHWPKGSAWLLAHCAATGPGPLSGSVDPWQPHGNRLAPPRSSDTAGREELASKHTFVPRGPEIVTEAPKRGRMSTICRMRWLPASGAAPRAQLPSAPRTAPPSGRAGARRGAGGSAPASPGGQAPAPPPDSSVAR